MKQKVAIILSGGRGTRLKGIAAPFTKTVVPINGLPVIAYAVRAVEAFVDRILLVAHPSTADIITEAAHLGFSQKQLPCMTILQPDPKGMADAMRLGFTANEQDSVAVVLAGDNIVLDPTNIKQVLDHVTDDTPGSNGALLAWTYRDLPSSEARRFSVYKALGPNRGMLIEKPQNPPGTQCWCGPVAFRSTKDAAQRCRELIPSGRGEYEATDLMNSYIKNGQASSVELVGHWFDIGTPAAIVEAERTISAVL